MTQVTVSSLPWTSGRSGWSYARPSSPRVLAALMVVLGVSGCTRQDPAGTQTVETSSTPNVGSPQQTLSPSPPNPKAPDLPALDTSCQDTGDCGVGRTAAPSPDGCCFSCDSSVGTHASVLARHQACARVLSDECPTKKCAAPPLVECRRGQCEPVADAERSLVATFDLPGSDDVSPLSARISVTITNHGDAPASLVPSQFEQTVLSLAFRSPEGQRLPTIPPPVPHPGDERTLEIAPGESLSFELPLNVFSPSLSDGQTVVIHHRLVPSRPLDFRVGRD